MTLRRPKKPGSRSGAEWTDKQRLSFRIFGLRGLWHLASRLTPARATAVQAIIDEEIFALGAEPEIIRYTRRRVEMALRWAAEDAARAGFEDLPF